MYCYEREKNYLLNQFDACNWINNGSMMPEQICCEIDKIDKASTSRLMTRAKSIALILTSARIAVDDRSPYAEAIEHSNHLIKLRDAWINELRGGALKSILKKHELNIKSIVYDGNEDFGHVCPDWDELFKTGIPGIVENVRKAKQQNSNEFILACEIVLGAVIIYITRLVAACEQARLDDTAQTLKELLTHEPRTLREAYQLIDLIYMLLTNVEGENLRSLGRPDKLLGGIYETELRNGTPKEELTEYTKQFFAKLHSRQ